MKKNPCWVIALVLAGAAGCVNGSEADETPELSSVDEEAMASSPLADVERTSARPCGDNTIAVITDERNNRYVFCALGDGRVGVLENTWNPDVEAPLTDRIDNPVELLKAVVPGADLTPEILSAVRTGTQVKEPLVVGQLRHDVPRSSAAAGCNFETFQDTYCGSAAGSYWDQFASEFVTNHSGTYPDLHCTHGNRFCNSIAGTHQLIASSNQAYLETGTGAPWSGACAAKERVVSCGGSTTFSAWQREVVDSGSWVVKLDNFVIPENTYATWILSADSSGNCAPGADRDDMRYRTESASGAYHNYSLFFLKWVDDSIACEPK
ncbi:hypothetical protein [Polyangium aurulentum]|uniref:hypothetical protein n=1 Tax=Polyangium aurulentum TaxID=2567896 RepID=UPI0010ADB2A7|nr:hypothetical protein [Polyangium aurulentum]UQA56475.1 hypothetical protein E8A73_034945 [Polyangium aurulentum]